MQAKAVSFMLAGLAAAGAAVVLVVAPSAEPRHKSSALGGSGCPPGKKYGKVVRDLTVLWVNGHQTSKKNLHAKDVVKTDEDGEARLCLKQKPATCTLWGDDGSRVRVGPAPDVAYRLTKGELDCETTAGSEKYWESPGAKVKVGDPVFALIVSKKTTVVKVRYGVVEVQAKAGTGRTVDVSGDQQSTVTTGQDPSAPKPLVLSSREVNTFTKLQAQQPRNDLRRPAIDDSRALRDLFARHALVVDFDKKLAADAPAETFARSFLTAQSKAWGVRLVFVVTSSFAAAPDLSAGKADGFVTSDPVSVARYGVSAVPFFAGSRLTLVQLALRPDAGLTNAIRRYVSAAALRTRIYARQYKAAFSKLPPFTVEREIAFPSPAHATGKTTIVHSNFVAVKDRKLAPGLKIVGRVKGACSVASSASARADAWACIDQEKRSWDPCFEGLGRALVCPADPPLARQVHVVELFLTAPLPRAEANKAAAATAGPARLVKTAAPGRCVPYTNRKAVYGGSRVAYACLGLDGKTVTGYLVGDPFRPTTPWVILTVPPEWSAGKTVVADSTGIAEIWWW